jgi:adenine C2-methylase RlmN of 23S rRNA A2503 and tRNA A37
VLTDIFHSPFVYSAERAIQQLISDIATKSLSTVAQLLYELSRRVDAALAISLRARRRAPKRTLSPLLSW